jgi:hypothetical protein
MGDTDSKEKLDGDFEEGADSAMIRSLMQSLRQKGLGNDPDALKYEAGKLFTGMMKRYNKQA